MSKRPLHHAAKNLHANPELAVTLGYDPNAGRLARGSVVIPTILDAIAQKVSPETRVLFARGCEVNSGSRAGFDEAVQVAHEAMFSR